MFATRGITIGILGLAFALAACGCAPKEQGTERAPRSAKAGVAPAVATGPARAAPHAGPVKLPDDAAAARALYDESVRFHLAGDEVAAEKAMIALAARYPETRHGRRARARLGGGGIWIPMAGIMAAVAIPAFMKYIRRSKSTEAVMNLERIRTAAEAFRAENGRYPPPAPLTPARPACRMGESEKIQPSPALWDHPGWKALGFALTEPHYYQYEFRSAGEGAGASFTARAYGDLDCDGELSTFERSSETPAMSRVDELE